MMAEQNRYPGVNPHLNSALQSPGGDWDTFHFSFISMLGDDIDINLPESYYVVDSASLQSRGFDEELPYEDKLTSLLIQYIPAANAERNTVLRIELLHPLMKASAKLRSLYLEKRSLIEYTGYRVLEIDLLHETSPLYEDVPDYSRHEPGASPYCITFIDRIDGIHRRDGFGVIDEFPVIDIPLYHPLSMEALSVTTDLRLVYDFGVGGRRLFTLLTDYTREPERIETYSEADQAYIRDKMQHLPPQQWVK